MSFLAYDLTFLIIFSLAVGIFLYIERKKLKRDGPMFLYKTSIGLSIIAFLGHRYKKTLKFLSYIVVACGYVLMFLMIYFLWQMLKLFFSPEFVRMVKIPPLMPIIPYLPAIFKVDWLPPFYFTYWILALAIVAIVHEGAHGIFAKFYGVKIKSTGFGFLGPFLAFFVEQDDKQMTKKKIFPQLTILAAGVFANIVIGFLFLILMIGFSATAYHPAGAMFNDYSYSIANSSTIQDAIFLNKTLGVDGLNLTKIELYNKTYFVSPDVRKLSKEQLEEAGYIKLYQDLPAINVGLSGAIVYINNHSIRNYSDMAILSQFKPGDKIVMVTKDITNKNKTLTRYQLTLGADYENKSRAVIGTAILQQRYNSLGRMLSKIVNEFRQPYTYYEPRYSPELIIFIYNLLWWIFIINISVALSNMLPAFIFDGGRFWYLTVLAITKKEKLAMQVFKVFTWALLAFFTLLMLLWAKGIFIK